MFSLPTNLLALSSISLVSVSASSVLYPRAPVSSLITTTTSSSSSNFTLQSTLCPGLSGTPQCCQLSLLGLAVLTCDDPVGEPDGVEEFRERCAAVGRSAECCLLPLLGLGIVCQKPL